MLLNASSLTFCCSLYTAVVKVSVVMQGNKQRHCVFMCYLNADDVMTIENPVKSSEVVNGNQSYLA